MADEALLEPIDDGDPCGPDLQWDPDFMVVAQLLDSLSQEVFDHAADGETAGTDGFDEIAERLDALCARSRDIRLLAMRAEVRWHREGLHGFSEALEDLVAAARRWPDPDAGCHPRADPDDGDLGERGAALGKLINNAPRLAATVGWGNTEPGLQARQETAARLREVFDAWSAHLEAAFGAELPLRDPGWSAIRELLGGMEAEDAGVESGTDAAGGVAPPVQDAWDLVERAAEVMSLQDRHSPALPILRMLLGWRAKDILAIAEDQRESGVGLEQLLDSVNRQLNPR